MVLEKLYINAEMVRKQSGVFRSKKLLVFLGVDDPAHSPTMLKSTTPQTED